MHEEVLNDAVPLITIQAKYKNVVATAFGYLNLRWTHSFLLFFVFCLFIFLFLYINTLLLPFCQKNKNKNVAATYPNGVVLSRLNTHVALHNEGNGLWDHIYPRPS